MGREEKEKIPDSHKNAVTELQANSWLCGVLTEKCCWGTEVIFQSMPLLNICIFLKWGSWLLKDIFFFSNTVSTSDAPANGPTTAGDAVHVPTAAFTVFCYGMSRMEQKWFVNILRRCSKRSLSSCNELWMHLRGRGKEKLIQTFLKKLIWSCSCLNQILH